MSAIPFQQSAGPILPVGVVIPTRNSRAHLERHLRETASWLQRVEQIVVVDSHSNDGTVELVRSALRHPRLTLLQHPPGLYSSWNHGIRQVRAPFTYVSTVGDVITPAGLSHLVDTIRRLDVDVLVSPPSMVDERGRPRATPVWPIHELIRVLGVDAPCVVDRRHAFFYAVHYASNGALQSILGSSASNLYRTEVLQRRPFPISFDSVGDTVWGVQNALHVSWGVTPRACARFMLHPARHRQRGASPCACIHEAVARLSRRGLRKASASAADPEAALVFRQLESLLVASRLARRHAVRLAALRRGSPLWVLRPDAWRARSRRNAARRRAIALRESVDRLVRDSTGAARDALALPARLDRETLVGEPFALPSSRR